MPFINADRIKETTITTGTGAITLAGAVSGFRAFYPTLSVGDTFKYFIVSTSGTEWESGLGTLTASSTLARTTVQSSSNVNPLTAVNFSAGLKEVGIGPTAGGETPWNPVTNTLDISVNALNDVAITSPTVNQVLKYSGTEWTNQADAVNVGTVTSVSGAGTVSGLTLTGTVTSSGSLTLGGAISTLNQSTTGNAATVTTNANLTGHITSVGNAAVLGSFTSAQLATALTDETGTGANVFATSPTLVTPLSNSLSAVPVASGAGNSVTIAAGSGVTSGAGGNLILQAGLQATSGGDGKVIVKQVAGQTSNLQEWQDSAGTVLGVVTAAGRLGIGTASPLSSIEIKNSSNNATGLRITDSGGPYYLFACFESGYPVIRSTAGNEFKIYQSNSGIAFVTSLGTNVRIGAPAATALQVYVMEPAQKGLTVRAVASQTANLQEWQNSAGTVQASVSAGGVVKTIVLTVATLPAAATAGAGARAFVSDATLTTFATVPIGGGANGVPVYSDGTNWYIG